jgi:para-nitrobenzyl esterase
MDRMEAMSEDCLRLNVWTASTSGKKPVMVWLHGGGYTTGSGGFVCYDGAQLAGKHDVVAVTVNHRLNAFGYLYVGDAGEKYALSGNAGMLDIVAALEWVRDNIAAFGGDPGNVTVFGQSGGGGKVSTLMAMPSAKGLFHRAIVQSGAAIKGISRESATKTTAAFMAKLNLKPGQLDELRGVPVDKMIAASAGLTFGPVVDGHALPHDPFDPAAPEQSADIPLLIGTVETETTFFAFTKVDPIDDAGLHASVKQGLRGATDAQVDQVIAAYKAGRPKASNTDIALFIASDGFRTGVLLEADRKAAQGKAPVYQYYFTWRTPVRDGKLRTPHAIEIPFAFDNVDLAKSYVGSGADRYPLATKISSAWTAFAHTGNPNCKELPKWTPYDTKQRATMIFDNECKVVNNPHGAEQKLLHSISA